MIPSASDEILHYSGNPGDESCTERSDSGIGISVRVKNIDSSDKNLKNFKLDLSSIALFDSLENFKEAAQKIVWQSHEYVRHPHLVIKGIIKDEESFDKVGFLLDTSNGSIKLVTPFLFTEEKCHSNQLRTINTFSLGELKLLSQEIQQHAQLHLENAPCWFWKKEGRQVARWSDEDFDQIL